MSVLPIDLQVLFSKSTEHQENIARHTNAAQMGQLNNFEKVHKESVQINEKVKGMEEYAEDFTKVHPDKKREASTSMEEERKKREKSEEKEEYKPTLKEEGKGTIIDITE